MKKILMVWLFLQVLLINELAFSQIDLDHTPNLFIWSDGWARMGITNKYYVTDDGKFYRKDLSPSFYIELSPQKIEEVKKTQECQPAENFPEGNWGISVDGFQLSLRFDKKNYQVNEPIIATLLLRNVSKEALNYSTDPSASGYSDGPISFKVISSGGKIIPQHSYTIQNYTISPMVGNLFPGTQVKFLERLDMRFNLTNGIYRIQAIAPAGVRMPSITIKNGEVIYSSTNSTHIQLVKSEIVFIEIKN